MLTGKEIWAKYWPYIIAAVLLIVLFIWIYFSGKKAGSIVPPKVVYPKGGDDIPESWNAEPLARELYDVMDGLFTLSGTKSKTFRKYADLATDEMFIAVYDVFNQLYINEGDGTLREWVNDEVWHEWTDSAKSDVLARMDRLNLP